MVKELRLNKILDLAKNNDIVLIKDIVDKVKVSESTVRRDIKTLEEKDLIESLSGGAIKLITDIEDSYLEKTVINQNQKNIIGKKAAKLIKDGDTIYIDSGTTTLSMIKYIKAKDITIVTSAPNIIHYMGNSNIRYIILGGEIDGRLSSIVGLYTEKMISEMYFDISFVGTNGYITGDYFYTFDERESRKKAVVISKSKIAYILADASKKNKKALSKFVKYEDVNLITEK